MLPGTAQGTIEMGKALFSRDCWGEWEQQTGKEVNMPELDTEKWQPVGVFGGRERKRRGHSASWGVRAPGSSPQTHPCVLFHSILSATLPSGLDSCGFKKEIKC